MLSRNQLLLIFGASIVLWLFISSGSRQKESVSVPSKPSGKVVFQQRLIAIGDLHGDIKNAQKALVMAGLIDKSGSWTGGTDILVQTGDIVDRGTYSLEIYRLMQRLRSEASGAGGRVISILGNHEVMNALGDWRYVTQADIEHWGSTQKRQYDLSIEGWLGQEWLANYSVTALVPLSPYPFSPLLSFTHGSLRPSFKNLLPYPKAINDLGHSLLYKALTPPLAPPYPPNPYSGLPRLSTSDEADLYNSGGPLWWRGLAETEDDTVVCGWAEDLKKKLGVKRLIGGHTVFDKIFPRCNASVIIIDTGMSSAYGGVLSALEILYTLTPGNTKSHPHQDPFVMDDSSFDGDGSVFWEREEVYAIYKKGKELIALEERLVPQI